MDDKMADMGKTKRRAILTKRGWIIFLAVFLCYILVLSYFAYPYIKFIFINETINRHKANKAMQELITEMPYRDAVKKSEIAHFHWNSNYCFYVAIAYISDIPAAEPEQVKDSIFHYLKTAREVPSIYHVEHNGKETVTSLEHGIYMKDYDYDRSTDEQFRDHFSSIKIPPDVHFIVGWEVIEDYQDSLQCH